MARFDLTDFEWSVIAPLLPRKSRGGEAGGGPAGSERDLLAMPNRIRQPVFSAWVYRQRNAVERFFNKLEHFRTLATRYDKRDDNFLASIQLAPMRIWLRTYDSVT